MGNLYNEVKGDNRLGKLWCLEFLEIRIIDKGEIGKVVFGDLNVVYFLFGDDGLCLLRWYW